MQYSKTFNILTIKIMKIFKFMTLALVAMLGFSSCSEDCNHEFIEVDYSKDLVGTWTCLTADYAEALVIKADGSVVSTGVENGEYWDGVKGSIKTTNNKMTLLFEDNDNYEGRFEMICGEAFTIFDENGKHLTYRYCANDLADEIVGMWVSTQTDLPETNMTIQTYKEDGKSIFTGFSPNSNDFMTNQESTYNVVGDLMFQKTGNIYFVTRLTYSPDGTAMGDILSTTATILVDDEYVTSTYSFLRIKQSLDLADQKYDYIKTYVSNVKGEDKDIPFLNTSFNFAKMDGSIIDKFLKSILFTVEFPDENTINYNFLLEGQNMPMSAPIEVEGNKMTIKMSENDPVFHDVVVYTFQDKDNSQMHMYMPTSSFEKFFANTSVSVMLGYGQLDKNDADAVAGVYQNVADAVHTINLSLVMSKSK